MAKVRTSSKEFKFKIQGQLANHKKSIIVNIDHNVQCKLNTGILVLELEDKVIEKPKEVIKEKPIEDKEVDKKKKKV